MKILNNTVHIQQLDEFGENFVGETQVFLKGTREDEINAAVLPQIGEHCWETIPDQPTLADRTTEEVVPVPVDSEDETEATHVRSLHVKELRQYAQDTAGIDASHMKKADILDALGYGTDR